MHGSLYRTHIAVAYPPTVRHVTSMIGYFLLPVMLLSLLRPDSPLQHTLRLRVLMHVCLKHFDQHFPNSLLGGASFSM